MIAPVLERSGYLLDTNAISEWIKPQPDAGVMEWLHAIDEDRLFLSVLTVGELRHGIDRMPNGQRKVRLMNWLTDEVLERFGERLLPVDFAVTQTWGRLRARVEAVGRHVAVVDALIAATAESHGLAVVTRNSKDFEAAGVPLICPWVGEN